MRTAKQLLELLTQAFPPFAGAKHAIVVYEGKVCVVLAFAPNNWRHITLEDEDLGRRADALLKDIASILAQDLVG